MGSLASRVIVETSAGADVVLRTALASVLAGAGAPSILLGDSARDREQLAFYADLAAGRDASAVFPRPIGDVAVRSTQSSRQRHHPADADVRNLSFVSPFEALYPGARESYGSHERNRTAWAQHWTHGDGPRPTLCVIHGFGASPYWFNSMFFSLPWFFSHGNDIVLYTMPLHGARRGAHTPMNGLEMFSSGITGLHEPLFQAVHDFRILLDHLQAHGAGPIAVTGLSLGGYVTSLLAAVEDRIALAIPNAPVTDIARLLATWFPASTLLALGLRLRGVPLDSVKASLAVHSPLTYPRLLERDQLLIIGGRGDRLAPPEQSEILWEHWDRPRLHWYPGNHTVHIERGTYLREMRAFMRTGGFAGG